ncbi:pyridoxal phosphate-dependent aminotransferase [Nonlabens ulvanivorans]|uniref:Histidinol-phosphate aminotransferase n=1 Tax=Nonlabens ulvanivorans TaxID=906888 RepID=A0A084JYW8_NONUL|nr:aminotransferase class I/II-fold pyridoxal phosphate-dependent enzyme [Nonlabens ulvanivorans]KEZ94152.1 histidinol-phosphate aminotransferase [Nonlabens ulvanivorans]PRX13141.1 histidinol-phosphate aminotransferase [Nonlabens ulvanivorans]
MEFNLENIVRKNIWNLKPYSSARSEFDLYGSDKNELTLLDANENPKGDLNRYPDPLQSSIKEELAKQKDISPNQIFVGNGSDEAIDLLYRIFCEPGKDTVITCPPTYGMYEVSAAINDVEVLKIPLNERFELDLEQILKQVQDDNSIKILWICSPNNPTGNVLLKADLKHDWQAQNYTRGGMMDMPFAPEFEAEMLENQRQLDRLFVSFNGIIVIDEAYQDFTENMSFIKRLEDYPNLVVLQTMSKAHGMAGARVGFAFSSPEIIELFNRTKPPYNVNDLSQKAVLEALQNEEKTKSEIQEIINNRDFLVEHLNSFDFIKEVYPSEANFVLAKVENATQVYNYLRDKDIIIRNRSSQIEDTLRFTVGRMVECKAVITALREYRKMINT